MFVLPKGSYVIVSDGGYPSRAVLTGCSALEGAEVAHLRGGSVEYAPVTGCGELSTDLAMVSGKAFEAPVRGLGDLPLTGGGEALTPAPERLGRVRRYGHQHFAHILGYALARSGGEGVEEVWSQYPGDAKKHAPLYLLKAVGGVEGILWGVALGGAADVEEFVSGLAMGAGPSGTRIRLGRDALQALTLALRRGGVRHELRGGEVVIRSPNDILIPHREGGCVWREPVEVGGRERLEALAIRTGGAGALVAGYLGWYLLRGGEG